MSVSVWPCDGNNVTLTNAQVITSDGASFATVTDEVKRLLNSGRLLTNDPFLSDSTPVPIPPTLTGDTYVDVRYFGARGDDDQTLYDTSYTSDQLVTHQTWDGIAINRAIRYLRDIGGGSMYIPRGTYRTYANLESLDFPIRIYGDGPGVTIVKNCDASPTHTNGFGILRIGAQVWGQFNRVLNRISIQDITFDGNADDRAEPVAGDMPTPEFRNDPINIQDFPILTLENCEFLNSPRDCLLLDANSPSYSTTDPAVDEETARKQSLVAINCKFEHSFRNTVSIVGGHNILFKGCQVKKGGTVHSGTSPRVCLDLETDGATWVVEEIRFENCLFEEGLSDLLSTTRCQSMFVGCIFNLLGTDSDVGAERGFILIDSKVEFSGCRFVNIATGATKFFGLNRCVASETGSYAKTTYTHIRGCTFEGCGLTAGGGQHNLILENTTFRNSLFPVYIADLSAVSDVHIRNLTLINVVDRYNANGTGGGTYSGFMIKEQCEARLIDIDGLTVMWDGNKLPADDDEFRGDFRTYGLTIQPTMASTGVLKVCNVHVSGYRRKLPAYYSFSADVNNFRDILWIGKFGSVTNTAPADTASLTVGSPFFRNVTEHGDNL